MCSTSLHAPFYLPTCTQVTLRDVLDRRFEQEEHGARLLYIVERYEDTIKCREEEVTPAERRRRATSYILPPTSYVLRPTGEEGRCW